MADAAPSPPGGAAGRTFPCDSCGADLEYHIGQRRLLCGYCGQGRDVQLQAGAAVPERDLEQALAAQRRLRRSRQPDAPMAEIPCPGCGATVQFGSAVTSLRCAFCGRALQRSGVHENTDRVPVDGMLPFQVDRTRAEAALEAWIRSRWFLPNDLRRRGLSGELSGVYAPFWTFDALTFTTFAGERGDRYTETVGSGNNRRQVVRTRWSDVAGAFQRFFDDVLVCASRSLPADLVAKLEPWPLTQVAPFRAEWLAGLSAETYSVSLGEGLVEARLTMEAALQAEVRRRIGGDEQRIHRQHHRYDALTYKHLLLPVWILAYSWRDRVRQVVVNATTGEVQGQRPWSAWKITLFVATLAAAAATVWALAQ